MTQIEQIKLMNDTTILYLKSIGESTKRNKIINKILEDETCFFKITKEDAITILEDIGVSKNNIETIYSDLISIDTYYLLQNEGKLKENDNNIKIKYENYSSNTLFNNSNKDCIFAKSNKTTNFSKTNHKENIFKKFFKFLFNFFKNNV